MKRQHPLLTSTGWVLTVVLFVGLAFSLWSSGGKAFSPGSLSAKSATGINLQGFSSHAEFENQCGLCHAPLESPQSELCLACHAAAAREIASGGGTHGLIENAHQCALCHSDHHGLDFDLTRSAYPLFAHEKTNFSLLKHQVNYDSGPISCEACHAEGAGFVVSDSSCLDCHSGKDAEFMRQHVQSHSPACLLCHDGQDRMMNFDHQVTRFPLGGIHKVTECVACHKQDAQADIGSSESALTADSPLLLGGGQAAGSISFLHPPTQCAQCHSEPEIHRALFDPACAQCHTTTAWLPAKLNGRDFDHTTTDFSLIRHQTEYSDQPIACTGCHSQDLKNIDLQRCITCHAGAGGGVAFIEEHLAQFGPDCLQCHDGADRMSNFDHASFFPLDGRHAELECEQCHQKKKFVGTISECMQCHAEPEIHAGFFGVQCQYCHTSLAWTPATLRQHTFPLNHGNQGEVACQVCHPASYTELTCYGCHDHQPEPIAASHQRARISLEELPKCIYCHSTGKIESDDE